MKKMDYQTWPRWYEKMQEFLKDDSQNVDVLFLGDSIVEAAPIEKLDLNLKIVNRGIISEKTPGIIISLDDRVFRHNPKIVVLSIGTNDICDGYTIEEACRYYQTIVNKLLEKNIKVIVCTITPMCYYKANKVIEDYQNCRTLERLKAYNDYIRNIKDVYHLDAYNILNDGNDSLSLDDTSDGLHLTYKGYEKLKKPIEDLIKNII